jgi:hypothetical protein
MGKTEGRTDVDITIPVSRKISAIKIISLTALFIVFLGSCQDGTVTTNITQLTKVQRI